MHHSKYFVHLWYLNCLGSLFVQFICHMGPYATHYIYDHPYLHSVMIHEIMAWRIVWYGWLIFILYNAFLHVIARPSDTCPMRSFGRVYELHESTSQLPDTPVEIPVYTDSLYNLLDCILSLSVIYGKLICWTWAFLPLLFINLFIINAYTCLVLTQVLSAIKYRYYFDDIS